ncbi:hypothetical protein EG68_08491 [Paragonimus skrjabini miyazakii]|uniref:Transcriptional activator protein Pur-alpha n=1 Tax=Paragonimus skrjabini miyazakii TaxID=59628 RepID=A0A8S9YMC4_9TREM|nr:hypothetical protein EG68_08491 [Paragonimus skrjabini miyazakii]
MNPLIYRPQPNMHLPMMHYLPSAPPHRRDIHDEVDLGSVALQVQRKRFYVDVKRNRRGIFMKIAEVGPDGQKARILLTLNAAIELREKLKDLIDVLDEVLKKDENESSSETKDKNENGTKTSGTAPGDDLIKSHIVNFPFRRYFLDLKRNKRGHFLRLTMLSTLNRIQLAVPSEGMLDLYNAMNDLLNKWWSGSKVEEHRDPKLPESKSMRVDNRTLYFDSAHNRFGTYLRISEVRTSSRTAITIPVRSLFRFRDIINGLAEDLTKIKLNKTSDNQPPSDESDDVKEIAPITNGDNPS